MKNRLLLFSLCVLTGINILQAGATELLQDEAYYWVYSNFLDWGYFDHPPMVALYIALSDLVFSEELGVRFVSAILFSCTLYILWCLTDHKHRKNNTGLFLTTALSTALFQIYGFITVPDTPLLFFMVLFLLAYQKILKKGRGKHFLLLSIAMAGLAYSKYTSVLIVLFSLAAAPELLKKRMFWLSIAGALLLFFPHLLWQYHNDFPSIRYHLYERTASRSYKFSYTSMHFLNQIAIIGFTFPVVYHALYKNLKNKAPFQKALNYIVMGFFCFFFVSSFKGPTQAQWTVPISIPLILIAFKHLVENKKARKTFFVLAAVNLCVIAFARVSMAIEGILPMPLETHGNKRWVTELDKETKGTKKLFLNSYQNASLYWFYSKDTATTYNAYNSRKNQFNLLDLETRLTGQKVIQISKKKRGEPARAFPKKKGKLYASDLGSFYSLKNLVFELRKLPEIGEKTNTILFDIYNPYSKNLPLKNLETRLVFKGTDHETLLTLDGHFRSEKKELKALKNTSVRLEYVLPDTPRVEEIVAWELCVRNHPRMAFRKVLQQNLH